MERRDAPPLVVGFGFNHYQDIYRRNVATHARYAARHGYDHVFIENPPFTPLIFESTWLKIPLILSALAAGRQWVLYLDVDTEVSDRAPDFRNVAKPDKDVFMAHGMSGRVNAGVIIARNTASSVDLFSRILANAGMPLPQRDLVGWGDNGEVIHFTRDYGNLDVIDGRWNNNHTPDLADYIRHYSDGPMRERYTLSADERDFAARGKAYRDAHAHKRTAGTREFFADLEHLFREAIRGRPEFAPLDFQYIVNRRLA